MNPQVINDHVMLTTTLNSGPSFFPLKGQICTCYDFICNFYLNSTTYHIDIFTSSCRIQAQWPTTTPRILGTSCLNEICHAMTVRVLSNKKLTLITNALA